MSGVAKLLVELRDLPENELQKIRVQTDLLLDVRLDKDPDRERDLQRVHSIIVAVLTSHDISSPPFYVLPPANKTCLKRACTSLRQVTADSGIPIAKVTKLCTKLAVRYLQETCKPVKFRSVCSQLEGASGLLDHAFPSYPLQALRLIGTQRSVA